MRTFARPAADKLASLPDPAIFVLRTLIQIEQTNAATIQACTDYDMVVVRESLHRLEQLGRRVAGGRHSSRGAALVCRGRSPA